MCLTAAALAAAVGVSAPGVAFAKVPGGAPKLGSCIGPAKPCRAPAFGSLSGVDALAVSPDGKSVYASAYAADSVLSFRRADSRKLSLQGCFADGGVNGCAPLPAGSIAGAGGVAVSPGGGDVYVTAGLGRSVTRFSRDRAGELSFGACTANAGSAGCLDPASDPFFGVTGVVVGPGGDDIYTSSFDVAAVSRLSRGPDGSLPLQSCLADDGNFGCAATPGAVLEGAAGLALDPKGKDLYVASLSSGSLTHLRRRKDGSLRYEGCVAGLGANGCEKLPVESLLGASGVAVSADGKSIVVASQAGTVTSFRRSTKSGKVKFKSCFGDDGEGGCEKPKAASIAQATSVVLKGDDVYVASQGSDSLTRLALDDKGKLGWVSCVAPKVRKCVKVPAAALDGAYALALRGKNLYVGASQSGALSTFKLPRK